MSKVTLSPPGDKNIKTLLKRGALSDNVKIIHDFKPLSVHKDEGKETRNGKDISE